MKDREDGDRWVNWLQTNRYELNAMTMPQFLDWITAKVEAHGVGKVIPPENVMVEEADRFLANRLRETITARVLREADIEGQVAAELARIERPDLTLEGAEEWLRENPAEPWRDYVEEAIEGVLQ